MYLFHLLLVAAERLYKARGPGRLRVWAGERDRGCVEGQGRAVGIPFLMCSVRHPYNS